MSDRHPNENVPIVVLPDATGRKCMAADRRKIESLVRERLLLTSMEPYHKVQVEIERAEDESPRALIVSLLRAYSYTADRVRMTVDRNYTVKSIRREGS